MKQHWDCNSRRFSFADLECSALYLPNPLLGKKNVLIKVVFFFFSYSFLTFVLYLPHVDRLLETFNPRSTLLFEAGLDCS